MGVQAYHGARLQKARAGYETGSGPGSVTGLGAGPPGPHDTASVLTVHEARVTSVYANRQRIVEFLPTAHRGGLRLRRRHDLVELTVGAGAPSRPLAPSLVPGLVYNVPRGQPPAAAPRRTPCTTNSRRANAPSVSASPAVPSSTFAWRWAAPRPGSTSGGTATSRPGPRACTT